MTKLVNLLNGSSLLPIPYIRGEKHKRVEKRSTKGWRKGGKRTHLRKDRTTIVFPSSTKPSV